jgi:glycerol-3-phosphate acyltransferase PlsX
MRIALDAMGGDYAPREIVAGAVDAARELQAVAQIYLVGDESRLRQELASHPNAPSSISIVHASEVVGMEEKPALAVRRKRDSSIGRAVDLVKDGTADAVVSAGNTGAAVAACTLKLRTLEGVERPAIATVMPSPKQPFVLIDAGATVDCSARMLAQFAVMGSVFASIVLECERPRVGVMSVGSEETKGNDTTRDVLARLQKSHLNLHGNVEGHDLYEGTSDVVVCDGFVGNVVLKTSESVAHAIGRWMRREFKRNPVRLLGSLLLSGALKAMKRRLDPEMYGGAPLLGINGVCIITHGASSRRAIHHAIRVAGESVHHHLNDQIKADIARMEAAV